MNWESGFTATYYMTIVDPVTWLDTEHIPITGGQVKRTTEELMQSASIKCVQYPYSQEKWIRVYMNAKQEFNSGHEAIFTGLATSPTRSFNGRLEQNTLECYSVLKPADDILLPRGWYAPVKANGAHLIRTLLDVIPAPVEIEGESPDLDQAIIAEDGETNLSMVQAILIAINWRLRIKGDGTVVICAINPEPVMLIDSLLYDIIEPVFDMENDWYEVPNVLQAVCDDMVSIARDEDPESLYSIPNRGREIWAQETDCALNKDEPLSAYAMRRLKELQQVGMTISYDRRYDPRATATDFIRIKYPSHNIDGVFLVSSQTIELGYGARTSEEVMMV